MVSVHACSVNLYRNDGQVYEAICHSIIDIPVLEVSLSEYYTIKEYPAYKAKMKYKLFKVEKQVNSTW